MPHSFGAVRKQPLKNIRSIGGFYAFVLGKSDDVELSVVARSNYEAVKGQVRSNRLDVITTANAYPVMANRA